MAKKFFKKNTDKTETNPSVLSVSQNPAADALTQQLAQGENDAAQSQEFSANVGDGNLSGNLDSDSSDANAPAVAQSSGNVVSVLSNHLPEQQAEQTDEAKSSIDSAVLQRIAESRPDGKFFVYLSETSSVGSLVLSGQTITRLPKVGGFDKYKPAFLTEEEFERFKPYGLERN